MDPRRIETAPAWLLALAASALVLSWWVTRAPDSPPDRQLLTSVDRGPLAPLAWPAWRLPPAEPSVGVVRALPPLPWPTTSPAMLDSSRARAANGSVVFLGPSLADLAAESAIESAAFRSTRFVLLRPAAARRTAGRITHERIAYSEPNQPLLISAQQRWTKQVGIFLSRQVARRVPHVLHTAGWPNALDDQLALLSRGVAAWDDFTEGMPSAEMSTATLTLRAPQINRRSGSSSRNALPQISAYLKAGTIGGAYPLPESIGLLLDRVAEDREAAGWAWATAYRLRTLVASPRSGTAGVNSLLASLSVAAGEAQTMADNAAAPELATEMRRAGYALERRIATWQAKDATISATQAILAKRLESARWAMNDAADIGSTLRDPEAETLSVAKRVAADLERYESAPSAAQAEKIASVANQLALAPTAEAAALAQTIERDYRNANVRMALSADLINRLLPSPDPTSAPVRDRIAGTPVRGHSVTKTKIGIRLIPDKAAWRLGLEANGAVSSTTVSDGGAARLRSRGQTTFSARKLIVVDPRGMHVAPSLAEANSESKLTGITSQYDRVPFVGSFVRSTARDRYSEVRTRAKRQVETRIEQQVRQTLDQRAAEAMAKLQDRYQAGLIGRAAALGLEVTPLEMRTTETRVISRVRLAGATQLAAHTPRMRAPSDSVASVQLHDSAVNNAIEGLELAGARLTATELRERIQGRLQLEATADEATTEEATIRFAAHEPVRVNFAEGRVRLTLAIDELSVAGRRHRAFKVHTFYRPAVGDFGPELVQDGTPQIEGRMRTASRLHLHGVLGKVLGENRRLTLLAKDAERTIDLQSKLADLATTQLVIEDGWLGWAMGPRATSIAYLQLGTYVR
ncbi:hypothetical protein [Botrimarina hoheduenensis]|uniref:Uncharacterized protein n=1 Tax=Botrimarina hoheduenensis TaxID=2528000 RepID=A0A5C5VYB0_9BACT|nr:hypothetical protein [Botrimarina hoheduenensis]TWT42721.1 hypothetical protein Pla111_26940 [Botrimarina hoheduenensis]